MRPPLFSISAGPSLDDVLELMPGAICPAWSTRLVDSRRTRVSVCRCSCFDPDPCHSPARRTGTTESPPRRCPQSTEQARVCRSNPVPVPATPSAPQAPTDPQAARGGSPPRRGTASPPGLRSHRPTALRGHPLRLPGRGVRPPHPHRPAPPVHDGPPPRHPLVHELPGRRLTEPRHQQPHCPGTGEDARGARLPWRGGKGVLRRRSVATLACVITLSPQHRMMPRRRGC